MRVWNGHDSLLVMIIGDRVARVDVQDSTVQTSLGARIGDTEAAIRTKYAGRVAATPHKYSDGKYLTVSPASPSDSTYRLVFETDGQHVTRYRAGLLPAVGWVEGCS